MTPWRGRAHAQPLHRPWGVSFSSQRGSCPYKTQADGGRAAKSPRLPSRAICRAATGLVVAPKCVPIAGEPGSETQVWNPTHSKASPTQRVRSLVQAKEAGKRGAVPLGGLRRLSRPPQPAQLLDILFSPLQEAAQAGDAVPFPVPIRSQLGASSSQPGEPPRGWIPPILPPSTPQRGSASSSSSTSPGPQLRALCWPQSLQEPQMPWLGLEIPLPFPRPPGAARGWLQHRAGGGAGAGGRDQDLCPVRIRWGPGGNKSGAEGTRGRCPWSLWGRSPQQP